MIPHFRSFAFEARSVFSLLAASFHSSGRLLLSSVWNAFLLFVDILYFRLYGTQKSFFSLLRTKNIYKTLYNNGGALYNVPIVDKWIAADVDRGEIERASSLVN